MFNMQKESNIEKNYQYMCTIIQEMLNDEKDILANLSNISAVINAYMDKINWVGFYILKENELVLGPFQGMPACIRIKMGNGVCGHAALEKTIVMVDDVHEFPDHISCDSCTNSEIVLPIYKNEKVYGVLDVDSPDIGRFTECEKIYLAQISQMLSIFLSEKGAIYGE